MQALLNIKILQEDLMQSEKPFHNDLEKQVPEILHSYILSDFLTSREVISMVCTDIYKLLSMVLLF